jgi:pimeloyl-ACP methyl ester carboxylesterase
MSILTGLAIALLILIVVLLLAGAGAKSRLKAQYPPVGQLVDVGGYRLHIHCQGGGGPSVIMDSGNGDYGLSWALVQSGVAQFARACVYDRAGLGWSDPSPRPRTNQVMVEELHALLERAAIPKPYVLVGASLGGLNARLYAHTYPDQVAGLVLVDAVHEEQFAAESLQKSFRQVSRIMSLMSRVAAGFVRTGIPALKPSLLPNPGLTAALAAKMPKGTLEAYQALRVRDSKVITTSAAEMGVIMESHAAIRAQKITDLGAIPLVVIRHGKEQPMMGSQETARQMEENHVRFQMELAGQSANGHLQVAEESGHAIQLEQPQIVIDAIRQVVEAPGGAVLGRVLPSLDGRARSDGGVPLLAEAIHADNVL